MEITAVSTFWVKLYLSGPIEVAKQIIRQETMREGLCVTVESTTYIYTGGEEQGYVIGLINYARFPKENEEIIARAKDLLHKLLDGTYQRSATMMTPTETIWITKGETR